MCSLSSALLPITAKRYDLFAISTKCIIFKDFSYGSEKSRAMFSWLIRHAAIEKACFDSDDWKFILTSRFWALCALGFVLAEDLRRFRCDTYFKRSYNSIRDSDMCTNHYNTTRKGFCPMKSTSFSGDTEEEEILVEIGESCEGRWQFILGLRREKLLKLGLPRVRGQRWTGVHHCSCKPQAFDRAAVGPSGEMETTLRNFCFLKNTQYIQ